MLYDCGSAEAIEFSFAMALTQGKELKRERPDTVEASLGSGDSKSPGGLGTAGCWNVMKVERS